MSISEHDAALAAVDTGPAVDPGHTTDTGHTDAGHGIAPVDEPVVVVPEGPHPGAVGPPAPAGTRHLYPVPTVSGPHARLGVLWFAGVMAAAVLGDGFVALWFAATAALAALPFDPGATDPRSSVPRGFVPVAAASFPLAALAGARGLLIALFVSVVALLAGRVVSRTETGTAALEATAQSLVVVVAVGLAAASPVLAADLGTGVVIGLVLMASAYDSGAYLIGVGAGHAWEGPVAGIAGVAVVGFGLAVINAFGVGAETTWLVTSAAALLFPMGPLLASALAGDDRRHLPVLRRLDVLLVAGPVWIWVVAAAR